VISAGASGSNIATAKPLQEYSLMFGFRKSVKSVSILSLATLLAGATSLAQQTPKRKGHETNANRKARIERTIQDTYSRRYEIAGGGGYLRFSPGPTLQRNNEVTFWMTGTRYFTSKPKLGIVGDVRGAYGNAKVGNTAFNIENPQISQYSFMGGVNYRVYMKEKYAVSIFGTGGATLGKFDSGTKGIPAQYFHMWESGYRPVFSVGANLDYNLYPNLAIRVSPTFLGTMFRLSPNDTEPDKGTIQSNLGVNIGVVYRFGRIK
jgi:hypothetical protein